MVRMQPLKRLVERTKDYISPTTSPAPSIASTSSARTDTTKDLEQSATRKKHRRAGSFKWTTPGSSSSSSSSTREPSVSCKPRADWGDDIEGEEYIIPDYIDFVIAPSHNATPSPRRCNIAPSAFAAAHKAAFPAARRFPEVDDAQPLRHATRANREHTRPAKALSKVSDKHVEGQGGSVGLDQRLENTKRLTSIVEQSEPDELAISGAARRTEYRFPPTDVSKTPTKTGYALSSIMVSREVCMISQPVAVLKKKTGRP